MWPGNGGWLPESPGQPTHEFFYHRPRAALQVYKVRKLGFESGFECPRNGWLTDKLNLTEVIKYRCQRSKTVEFPGRPSFPLLNRKHYNEKAV